MKTPDTPLFVKTHIRPSASGLKFLGFVLSRDGRRVQQHAIKRFNRRLRTLQWQYAHGRIPAPRVRAALQAWAAHTAQANCNAVRRTLWRRVRLRRTAKP